MSESPENLQLVLQKYFGFETFRPLQEEIIRDALAGRDVFALLPTGGGKSLCFQLPALVRNGLTVVVSPLIALMKDQVDSMQANGVAATFLNSSLSSAQAGARMRGLHNGEFKLLYVAPERLMMPGFLSDLQSWQLAQIAIDEAHCISEWGHDFRPEYRQIASLRDRFPQVPLMALTATATERVRGDIVKLLKLRDPACYVASFNRPNLTYRVSGKAKAYDQILKFIAARPGECGIIYCHARKSTESLAEKLVEEGITAAPYHAGLEREQRERNQDSFVRDEVRVICATIAFGMGIDKPNVRFVLHYDLPKNIESYYQETGRAGRDGLPSECLLLFSPGDRIKHARFIDEKTDAHEAQVAREQLEQIVHYAESSGCRRANLLSYFGEKSHVENCEGCDNCISPRETFDGTTAAQKFISCVARVREKSGFGVGMHHIVEVLCGADTDKIRKWRHHELSTYNIGSEHTRQEWAAIGRELIRLGFLRQTQERFSTLEMLPEGIAVLKSRRPVTLARAISAPETRKHKTGDIECDEMLFSELRRLRKKLADEREVPAYVVFSDVALRQMAARYPQNETEFARISGVGEKKLREFGGDFTRKICDFLQSNPQKQWENGATDGIRTRDS